MNSQKTQIPLNSSFRRKPESSYFKMFWTPASAGVTLQETFYEAIKSISYQKRLAGPSRPMETSFRLFAYLLGILISPKPQGTGK